MNQSKNNQFEMNLFSTLNKALNILQNLQNKFHTKNYISPSNLKKNTIQQDNKITQSVFQYNEYNPNKHITISNKPGSLYFIF